MADTIAVYVINPEMAPTITIEQLVTIVAGAGIGISPNVYANMPEDIKNLLMPVSILED